MIDKGLCPMCKTGKELYELDKSAPECPYIGYYKNKSCPWFVRLDHRVQRTMHNGER